MAAFPASLATRFTIAFGVKPLQLYPVTTVFPMVEAVSSAKEPASGPYLIENAWIFVKFGKEF